MEINRKMVRKAKNEYERYKSRLERLEKRMDAAEETFIEIQKLMDERAKVIEKSE